MRARMSKIFGAVVLIWVVICVIGVKQAAFANVQGEHEGDFSLSLISLVRPLGICALGSLVITFLTGLFRRRLGRRFLKIHKIFAFITVAIALCHGVLVLVLF
jgi:hypothetical protein